MHISFEHSGSFSHLDYFLKNVIAMNIDKYLRTAGEDGVAALSRMTPTQTGETAKSWSYKVKKTRDSFEIEWFNSHVHHGAIIALLIQYGHGTRNGGYVQGYDYINPAMVPIFEQIANDLWRAVVSL